MLKASERDFLIKLVQNARPITASKYVDTIKALEALEVEPESRFKEGELCLFWDGVEGGITRKFKLVTESGSYMDNHNVRWNHCAHFTQWNEYKGVKPVLPEGALGWYIKFDDEIITTIPKQNGIDWGNKSRRLGGNHLIIEYAYWMEES